MAIALDPDRLGLLAGAAAGTVVLVVSLFYRDMDLPSAAVRAGLTCVVGYAAAFILVTIVKRVALSELAEHQEEERERSQDRTNSDETPGGE